MPDRLPERPQLKKFDPKKMEKAVELLLQGMGVDPADPNYRGTPRRVARMYMEMLSPRESHWSTFPASTSDLVLLRGHEVVGLCPHHLVPVAYTAHVGYIPNNKTVGLSKLARIVETQLVAPVMQEDLAAYVAQALEEQLSPKGVAVVLSAVHGCMRFRGVRSHGDVVVSVMKGVFHTDSAARAELLRLIGRP